MADSISTQIWYHGPATRGYAEARLESMPQGTYLFRDSETRKGYSLSVRVSDKTKHFIILLQPNMTYVLHGKPSEFASIPQLIAFHTTTPVTTADGTCLLYPCPRDATTPSANPPPASPLPSSPAPSAPIPPSPFTPEADRDDDSEYVALASNTPVNAQVMSEVHRLAELKRREQRGSAPSMSRMPSYEYTEPR